jgi:hypothetical protein
MRTLVHYRGEDADNDDGAASAFGPPPPCRPTQARSIDVHVGQSNQTNGSLTTAPLDRSLMFLIEASTLSASQSSASCHSVIYQETMFLSNGACAGRCLCISTSSTRRRNRTSRVILSGIPCPSSNRPSLVHQSIVLYLPLPPLLNIEKRGIDAGTQFACLFNVYS